MKKIIAVFLCWSAFACQAQSVDTASQLAATYFKEAEAASRNQRVWNEKLYGPMIFVEPESRVIYANQPDSAGILKPENGIYKGLLPKDVIIANTSIFWQGKRWSIIMWPLPTDHEMRLNLVLHESFHRIQEKVGLPERSPTADHLSGMYGRIYYLMELQALKAALQKPVNQRGTDLTNALVFREKRHQLFPETFENERILELSEGVAEYTGVILGRHPDSIRPHLYQQIDSAGARKSLIRSFEYTTGPVYGYLLYEKAPGWTLKIDSNSSFPGLIAQYYQVDLPKDPISDERISALEKKYNGDAIIRSEKEKEERRLQAVDHYTDLFTKKAVLTITLVKMGIGFNPSNLFDLGQYGTIYPTAEVKDIWGQLTVSGTTGAGMLMKDWKVVTLAASEGINQNGRIIEGNGWKIVLNDHWRLVKADPLHYQLVNKD